MPRFTRSEYDANQYLEAPPMRYRHVTHYTPPPRRAGIPALLGVLGLFAFLGILSAFSA